MERTLHTFWRRSSYRNRLAHNALDLLQQTLQEIYIACPGGLFELFRSARSDNGHINRGLGKHPGDGQLCDGQSLSGGQALQVLDDRDIALKAVAVEVLTLAAPVIRCEGRLWRERSAKQSMRQRTIPASHCSRSTWPQSPPNCQVP